MIPTTELTYSVCDVNDSNNWTDLFCLWCKWLQQLNWPILGVM